MQNHDLPSIFYTMTAKPGNADASYIDVLYTPCL